MNRSALAVAFLSVLVASTAYADCRYFRVGFKLRKCVEWKEDAPPSGDPVEGGEVEAGAAAQVTCLCDYALSGSDPRCDFDQAVEESSIQGVESVIRYCSRGKEVCSDVCPRALP